MIHHLDLRRRQPKPVLKVVLEADVQPRRSGWVVARAIYLAATGRLRQAHTSPIYVSVDDQPVAYRRDAEYMIRWIDRLINVSAEPDRYQKESDRHEVQAIFGEARAVYERIARTASEVWGD